MAAGAHLFIGRFYGKSREVWADKVWKADANSSGLKKLGCEITGMIACQLPIYAGILKLSGASVEEIAAALPAGLILGASTARPYGWFSDRWRKAWGTKPVLAE